MDYKHSVFPNTSKTFLKIFTKLFGFHILIYIFVAMKSTKQNRSKYNFGALKEVGAALQVDPEDVHSALVSLSSFNRRHNTNIVMDPDGNGVNKEGKINLVVTKI